MTGGLCSAALQHLKTVSLQVIDALKSDRTLGKNLEAPSVSYGSINLYMRGVLEEETKGNLSKVSLTLWTPCSAHKLGSHGSHSKFMSQEWFPHRRKAWMCMTRRLQLHPFKG